MHVSLVFICEGVPSCGKDGKYPQVPIHVDRWGGKADREMHVIRNGEWDAGVSSAANNDVQCHYRVCPHTLERLNAQQLVQCERIRRGGSDPETVQ